MSLYRLILLSFAFSAMTVSKAEVSFLATADCQYQNGDFARKESADNNFTNMFQHLDNEPELRGILIAGDLTQNTRKDEFTWYKNSIQSKSQFIFEGLGNHDVEKPGASQFLACLIGLGSCQYPWVLESYMVQKERQTPLLSKKKPHYSWQWDNTVFIQLNVFPGNEPSSVSGYEKIDPKNSLDFLIETLRNEVLDTGKNVVIVHHYGFDSFSRNGWWTEEQRNRYWEVLSGYDIAAIITGHVHLGPDSTDWYIPWMRPASTSSGPDFIPTFVAGGGLFGAYISVSVDGNTTIATRHGSAFPNGNSVTVVR